ncbi:MAG TPA: cell division protein ZapE [Woeseiaceae bacterium]|nr:cell division protein ZapE [Woeseiaceae bacterium]
MRTAYRDRTLRSGMVQDSAQECIVDALQALQDRITRRESPWQRFRRTLRRGKRDSQPRGIYLWGGVGRGKTFLVDLFFETLDIRAKRRVHFHRMMSEVHSRLKNLRHTPDPLESVAADLAADARVLCFDEFFVSDIGDAMILGRLLDGLIRRGVTIVATSNVPPGGLYPNGLQRERLLPAIALLQKHSDVMELAGTTDYRLRLLQSAGTFLYPADEKATAKLDRYFHEIAAGEIETDVAVDVVGRSVRCRKRAVGIAWFDFQQLCEGPRSQEDYIEIARWYPTVILSNVPVLTVSGDNAARRFIALVDEFYDRRVKLLVSAAAPIEELYTGRRLAFEFQRTTSRLIEMQSTEYLHAQHLP